MTDEKRVNILLEKVFWGIIISAVVMIITFEAWSW